MGQLKPHFLGQRLLAAAKLARWELEIVNAAQKAIAKRREYALRSLAHMPSRTVTASVPADAFGLDAWGDDVEREVTGAVNKVFVDVREGTAARFGIGATDLPDIDVTRRAGNLINNVQGIGPRTADRLTHSLTQGVNAGESYDKLAERVSAVFDTAESDAMRIARTEVAGAANGLSHDYASAVNSGGLALQKTWLSTLDERTRGNNPKDEFDHVSADGETVGMDEMFEMTGEELEYPGDENGSPGNIINCRCTVIYDEAGTTYEGDLHIGYGDDVGGSSSNVEDELG